MLSFQPLIGTTGASYYKCKLSRIHLQRLTFSLKLWSFGMSFWSWWCNSCWFRKHSWQNWAKIFAKITLLVYYFQETKISSTWNILLNCPSIFVQWTSINLITESYLTGFYCDFLIFFSGVQEWINFILEFSSVSIFSLNTWLRNKTFWFCQEKGMLNRNRDTKITHYK